MNEEAEFLQALHHIIDARVREEVAWYFDQRSRPPATPPPPMPRTPRKEGRHSPDEVEAILKKVLVFDGVDYNTVRTALGYQTSVGIPELCFAHGIPCYTWKPPGHRRLLYSRFGAPGRTRRYPQRGRYGGKRR